jgi:hypothetical protein
MSCLPGVLPRVVPCVVPGGLPRFARGILSRFPANDAYLARVASGVMFSLYGCSVVSDIRFSMESGVGLQCIGSSV